MRRTLLITALCLCSGLAAATPASAQQIKLAFNDGLVSLDATAVPIRQILNEWAKLGGTKVIGSERVTGAPLTLKLVDVPESQALEIILRSVAGYMAAPRHAGVGASRYDRILVMATSAAPATPASAVQRPPQPNPAFNGTQRFVPPSRQRADDEEEKEEEDPNPPQPPVFTFPSQPGAVQPGGFNQPQNFNGQPMIVSPPMQGGQQPQMNYPTPNVTVPFGSTAPGVINAPPQPPGQTRPPGGGQ